MTTLSLVIRRSMEVFRASFSFTNPPWWVAEFSRRAMRTPLTSASPVKLGIAKPAWVLAAEDIRYDSSAGLWNDGAPPHQRHGTRYPDGGNTLTCDGAVSWIKIERMYEITTYNTTTRLWYFYQDDLTPIPAAAQNTFGFKWTPAP